MTIMRFDLMNEFLRIFFLFQLIFSLPFYVVSLIILASLHEYAAIALSLGSTVRTCKFSRFFLSAQVFVFEALEFGLFGIELFFFGGLFSMKVGDVGRLFRASCSQVSVTGVVGEDIEVEVRVFFGSLGRFDHVGLQITKNIGIMILINNDMFSVWINRWPNPSILSCINMKLQSNLYKLSVFTQSQPQVFPFVNETN